MDNIVTIIHTGRIVKCAANGFLFFDVIEMLSDASSGAMEAESFTVLRHIVYSVCLDDELMAEAKRTIAGIYSALNK